MQTPSISDRSATDAARVALSGAILVLLLLAALHVLSPEFDPAWRVVSEYANGHYGWVLTLMFACWAISSWALAFALQPHLRTLGAKIGLWFLAISGIGEALAAIFDINQPLHGLGDVLGVPGFAIGAIVISIAINRSGDAFVWASAKKPLLWTAILSVIMVVLMIGSVLLLFETFVHAGGHVPADGKSLPLGTMLPHGAIALDGYVNRLLVVVFCAWNIIAARQILAADSLPQAARRLTSL